MKPSRKFLFGAVLVILPLLVGAFGLSFWSALLLVILALVWRQAMLLGSLMAPDEEPELVLETIPPSHFAERGRWCLDRLGVAYRENAMGGVIGVFFLGRTVPMLTVRTGRTRSAICDSSHILRYLYGRYCAERPEAAAFLEPTPERLEWEQRLDRYGRHLQVWVYRYLLDDPALCKQAWGSENPSIPAWQRWAILVFYPVLEIFMRRAFQPEGEHFRKAVERVESFLADAEAVLEDGRHALLGGDESDFVDVTLASLSSLWIQPDGFAAGRHKDARLEPGRLPSAMRADMQRWREAYPATTAHIERLYAEERAPTAPSAA